MRSFLPLLLPLAYTFPTAPRAQEGVYFILAGDSTTASGSGWGDGFLDTTVANGSYGHNYGHKGATTASFRAGGDWANVLNTTATHKSRYDVWVTIQFGHNDQKNTSGVTVEDFKTNLKNFADEASAAGGTPVLLTPLTRRNFDNTTGLVIEDLAPQVNATIEVATTNNIKWINLNKASEKYVNEIGIEAAEKYNLAVDDWTHLNTWGSVVFARIVSDLLKEKYPQIDYAVKPNATLSAEIKAGVPA